METTSIKCNFCQQVTPQLRKCSRCLGVYYCSKPCQSIDWPIHRRVCNTPGKRKIRSNFDAVGAMSINETPMTAEYNSAGERSVPIKEGNQRQTQDETKLPFIQRQSPVLEMETADTANNAGKSDAIASSDVDTEPQGAISRPKGAACTDAIASSDVDTEPQGASSRPKGAACTDAIASSDVDTEPQGTSSRPKGAACTDAIASSDVDTEPQGASSRPKGAACTDAIASSDVDTEPQGAISRPKGAACTDAIASSDVDTEPQGTSSRPKGAACTDAIASSDVDTEPQGASSRPKGAACTDAIASSDVDTEPQGAISRPKGAACTDAIASSDVDTEPQGASSRPKGAACTDAIASSDVDTEPQGASSRPKGAAWTYCGVLGCEQKCSRCKRAVYCSRHCQQQDWTMHKKECKKKLSEEDKRIMKSYLKKKKSVEKDLAFMSNNEHKFNSCATVTNFGGSPFRFDLMLSLEQSMMRASRPEGSLQSAVREAKENFPGFKIITNFSDVLHERYLFFMPPPSSTYLLVAFIYRYHEHAMRHGVYLKDDEDSESKVEFYLDEYGDNPYPFFSYQQVKPGEYICLVKPVMHVFMDGTVGIRVNHPYEAVVLRI